MLKADWERTGDITCPIDQEKPGRLFRVIIIRIARVRHTGGFQHNDAAAETSAILIPGVDNVFANRPHDGKGRRIDNNRICGIFAATLGVTVQHKQIGRGCQDPVN
eukprot:TRINITY_DN5598_c0_g2_i2.p2 TRINITY_DN5598_c0_g2~~TRINITY_DN5598_c0_g2_i2.p2  ORF type:complete len:106 (+),score=0.36 TRINITY_DN5598_c0_g2_i2:196-513(+)